eukprot:jgi/Bigna1/76839/fgenesh1_pg.44_\
MILTTERITKERSTKIRKHSSPAALATGSFASGHGSGSTYQRSTSHRFVSSVIKDSNPAEVVHILRSDIYKHRIIAISPQDAHAGGSIRMLLVQEKIQRWLYIM